MGSGMLYVPPSPAVGVGSTTDLSPPFTQPADSDAGVAWDVQQPIDASSRYEEDGGLVAQAGAGLYDGSRGDYMTEYDNMSANAMIEEEHGANDH